MSQQNISDAEKRRKHENLAFNQGRGGDLAFFFYGVHKDEDHRRFEEGNETGKAKDPSSEQQSNAQNSVPNSQDYRNPSAQGYPYANPSPNGFPQDGPTSNVPSMDNQKRQLMIEWPYGPIDQKDRSYMTQSPVHDDSKPNAPVQGVLNSAPPVTPNPKYVRISMYSPISDCWEGLLATNDPGTDENWINSRIFKRQKFRVKRGKLIKTMNFNGQEFTSGATITATWNVSGSPLSHQNEFRVNDNGPFDVIFGRNLLSEPEINYFRDDGVDDTPIILEQSDISPQEQEVIDRNRAAADARARDLEQRRRPIKSSNHRNSEKIKKPSSYKSKGH